MTNEEIHRIQFQWLLAWVVINHCRNQQAKIKIRGALYGLQRRGVVRRVGKDLWEAVR